MHHRFTIFIKSHSLVNIHHRASPTVSLAQKVSLRPQMVEFLKIKDRALRQEEIFPDILLMVPILHLFLVNIINKLLDFVLVVLTLKLDRRRTSLLLNLLLVAKELLLQKVWELWDLKIFTVLRLLL